MSGLGDYVGQQVVICGIIIEQRTHRQITGEPMKFLTLADWIVIVETELFAPHLPQLRAGHLALSRARSHRDGGVI